MCTHINIGLGPMGHSWEPQSNQVLCAYIYVCTAHKEATNFLHSSQFSLSLSRLFLSLGNHLETWGFSAWYHRKPLQQCPSRSKQSQGGYTKVHVCGVFVRARNNTKQPIRQVLPLGNEPILDSCVCMHVIYRNIYVVNIEMGNKRTGYKRLFVCSLHLLLIWDCISLGIQLNDT